MSTHLRDVPDCKEPISKITQTKFWGGAHRMQCVSITQPRERRRPEGYGDWFNTMELTRHQAKMLAVELMLFAEGREVEFL